LDEKGFSSAKVGNQLLFPEIPKISGYKAYSFKSSQSSKGEILVITKEI